MRNRSPLPLALRDAHASLPIAGSTGQQMRFSRPLVALGVAALMAACGGGGNDAPELASEDVDPSSASQIASQRDSVVSYLLARDAGDSDSGFQLGVLGVDLDDVRALNFNGVDLMPAMNAAAAIGRGEFRRMEDGGFYFLAALPPSDIGLQDEGELSVLTSAGQSPSTWSSFESTAPAEAVADQPRQGALAAVPGGSVCAALRFRPPTTVSANKSCGYGSQSCGVSGKAHTGIDYSGNGSVVAVADGVVVRTETMNANDHGMGTSVILRHRLWNCREIYSSYSHLASIDKKVKVGTKVLAGQTIGKIGGSGYGKPNYWGTHAHVEFKTAPVTGNALGVGNKRSNCKADARNAGPSKCWGYVDSKLGPGAYGYLNPLDYIGK